MDTIFTGSRGTPAIKLGNLTTLHLVHKSDRSNLSGGRQVATMIIDHEGQRPYIDCTMSSGCQGFGSNEEVFKTYLNFILAALEGQAWELRTGGKSENTDLFPEHVIDWMNQCDIESTLMDLEGEPSDL